MSATLFLLLAACGGRNDETTLNELRVVAMIAEPPEVGPGQSTTLTSVIVDPTATGVETLTWTCTDLGAGCLEPSLGLPWYVAGTPDLDGVVSATFAVPSLGGPPPGAFDTGAGDTGAGDTGAGDTGAGDTGAGDTGAGDTGAGDTGAGDTGAGDTGAGDTGAGDTGAGDTGAGDTASLPAAAPLVGAYTLACAPGVCPVIAKARDGTLEVADIADTTALLKGLPLTGTSLATRRIWLGSGVNAHQNPVVTLTEAPVVGSEIALRFTVTGTFGEEPSAYGYAEGGAFDAARYRIADDGTVTLTWLPPEEGGLGNVYVVFNDGLGGTALWRRTLEGTAAPAEESPAR